jgi:integrase
LGGLRVGDVRLWLSREVWSGMLAVRRTKRKLPGGWFTDTPKSNRSIRDVSLPSRIAEALNAYLATHPNRQNRLLRSSQPASRQTTRTAAE